jgi:hypothetical protein
MIADSRLIKKLQRARSQPVALTHCCVQRRRELQPRRLLRRRQLKRRPGSPGGPAQLSTAAQKARAGADNLLSSPDMDVSKIPRRKAISLALVKEATRLDDDALLEVTSLPLSWRGITEIDGLELYSHVQNLFLQHNFIRTIEGLDFLQSLRFLALGGNRIEAIGDGLIGLRSLEVLDLSDNRIAAVPTGSLPRSLRIVNLAGNPYAADGAYRRRLAAMLPRCACTCARHSAMLGSCPFFDNRTSTVMACMATSSALRISPWA